MKVKDLMTKQPKVATPETTLAEAADLLWTGDCGILPVVDKGKLMGVVTDRDMFIALATRNVPASVLRVADVASGTVWACAPDDDVHVALDIMKTRRVRRLPVVDRGTLVGIISMNDIVLAAGPGSAVGEPEVVETLKSICAHTPQRIAAAAA